MVAIWHATISDDGIELGPYDLPGSAFHPRGRCAWADVREIDPAAWPPEVRTDREVVFVPAPQRRELEQVAAVRGIATVARLDVWALLLEPFLDTAFDGAAHARNEAALARAGIDRQTCASLRDELGPAMVAYNIDSMLWDWFHLGLCDALCALRGQLAGARFRLADDAFAAFFRRAMALALAAPAIFRAASLRLPAG